MRRHLHTGVRGALPTAAALAAAMGVGRFVYTPILPLMTAQAGLPAPVAGHLATANYVGYLVGAVATTLSPRLARSGVACRAALVTIVASLAVMPVTTHVTVWLTARALAGVASAVVFVVAINTLLERLPERAGWGFGGVGAGIALSAALVLALPTDDWRTAWWTAAGLAGVLAAAGWSVHPRPEPRVRHAHTRRTGGTRFLLLFTGYTLEGVGYIIAGTFLVAAVAEHSPGALGASAWLVVGLAVVPSAALWARLGTRHGQPAMLTAALALQAIGIALACQGGVAASLMGALLFGATFIGVSTLAVAEGRLLGIRSAVALLTVGYSVGQIVGPLLVAPLTVDGYRPALVVSAMTVSGAALATAVVWILSRHPRARLVDAEIGDVSGEFVDDGKDRRPTFVCAPHE
ncbi:YbfB/YjiJ family MFS transporter [Mycolicibacterium sp. 018/SC-01/001]|nr:YbfB/YjiJ family MFS transporter [Mycolicibacterium sp. 018/SC-01/001]